MNMKKIASLLLALCMMFNLVACGGSSAPAASDNAPAAGTEASAEAPAAEGEKILTSGGRVLSVTGVGANLREAVDRAYARVKAISFDKMFYRKDIAHRAFERG